MHGVLYNIVEKIISIKMVLSIFFDYFRKLYMLKLTDIDL